ncbi:MAG: hypothetical protein IMZ62_19135 [Chloroflexi bacterium]|nr:hypothetical protein [Chloroflexota bacterium]
MVSETAWFTLGETTPQTSEDETSCPEIANIGLWANESEASLVEIDLEGPNELPAALRQAYRIVPEGAYSQPQRIWVPVPRGYSPKELTLYYYLPDDDGRAVWHPAEQVLGWVVPNSREEAMGEDGTRYVGILASHSGTVRLAPPPSVVLGAATVLLGSMADVLMYLVLGLVLAGFSRIASVPLGEPRHDN